MIVRTVKAEEYDTLQKDLIQKAVVNPVDSSYMVELTISGVEYAVKLLLTRRYRVVVLRACRLGRGQGRPIADNAMLNALLEILLYQGIR